MTSKENILKLNQNLDEIYNDIKNDSENKEFIKKGWNPLYFVSATSQILIIGQAPGLRAQENGIAWDDLSGDNLRNWLGVSKDQFYDKTLFGIIPMDFFFPGKGKSGDLPPRKGFAQKWHPKILSNLVDIKLIILMGNYALKHYLGKSLEKNLTLTVKNYHQYLPLY